MVRRRRGIVLLVVLAAAPACSSATDAEVATTDSGPAPAALAWREAGDAPLSARRPGAMVWTGSAVLVAGGSTFLCPPGASCVGPTDPPLQDAALLDPATGEWRAASPSPLPVGWSSAVLVGGDVYVLAWGWEPDDAGDHLLRYDVTADRWDEVALPAGVDPGSALAPAGDDGLVVYAASHEAGGAAEPDLLYRGGEWSELPLPPLSAGFDRAMVWSAPHLYLFDRENVDQPGSAAPSIARAARLDLAAMDWERLPDSEAVSSSPWFATGDALVNPTLGGADGGETGNWGRTHPYGGVLDLTTLTWEALPPAPDDLPAGGAFGAGASMAMGPGWTPSGRARYLDVERRRWIEVPPVPGAGGGATVSREVVGAGCHLVAFGGERWRAGVPGELLADGWILDLPSCGA